MTLTVWPARENLQSFSALWRFEQGQHLRRILGKYAAYYNESRIHRALDKDAPFHRAIERVGAITSQPVLGGLHHQYCRI
jgi:hypothetical protein